MAGRLLAQAELRVITPTAFQQSLYLAEGRFLTQGMDGFPLYRRHLSSRQDTNELRPCFLLASREPGMAGLCPVEVRVLFRDPSRRPLSCKQEMLVTDRPLLYVPDLPAVTDLQQVRAFELLRNGQPLGMLPVSPTPSAAFTTEGGFRAPAEIDWTPFTEEELFDRLEKLMQTNACETPRSPAPFADRDRKDWALASLAAAWDPRPDPGAAHTP
jgi:hypothetical protein